MTFDEFAGARLEAVLRFATALTGDPHLAKDLVQEVLIRVSGRWQEIGQLDRRRPTSARWWLMSICRGGAGRGG